MKYLLVSVILLSLVACKKVDKLTQFNMKYDEVVSIPSSTGVDLPFNILSPDITTNSESTFASEDTRKDLIEQIILTNLELSVVSPSSEDFSFLKSISVFISAEGLPETKIAYQENIPDNAGSTLSLTTTNADLKEYIKQDFYSLRVNATTDEFLAEEHRINVHSVFFVDAKLLGQ
ncbi:MAG: hypothetical protein EP338_04925 [Bacteroidetes bacterium]|nr:MAG: hypothetical protein EP338_04925 [Bacteroidota bacterium]